MGCVKKGGGDLGQGIRKKRRGWETTGVWAESGWSGRKKPYVKAATTLPAPQRSLNKHNWKGGVQRTLITAGTGQKKNK